MLLGGLPLLYRCSGLVVSRLGARGLKPFTAPRHWLGSLHVYVRVSVGAVLRQPGGGHKCNHRLQPQLVVRLQIVAVVSYIRN